MGTPHERLPHTKSPLPPEITRGKEIDLSGQTAVITGASDGIGRAIALKLAFHGANIIGISRKQGENVDNTMTDIRNMGRNVFWVYGDTSRKETAENMLKTIEEEGITGIDILVNNVGTTRDTLLARMSEDNWDTVMDTKVKSAFNMSKAVSRMMMRKKYGRIINITSIVGIMGNAGQTNYAAANAAVIGFTKALAREIGSRNITVNAVAPGFIRTRLTEQVTQKQEEEINNQKILPEVLTTEDIAEAVLFFASDRARVITGQTLTADGGIAL